MFFLWIRAKRAGKEYYLPQLRNWSGRLHVGSNLTGAAGVELPVSASEGEFSVQLPAGFEWDAGTAADGRLTHCS